MRLCLKCKSLYEFDCHICGDCGHKIEQSDGVERFVDVSHPGGFDRRFFKSLSVLEADNFWFKARNDLIAKLIRKYAPETKKYFEIGCGTGFVLERIASELESAEILASEYFLEGLVYAKERVPRARFIQLDGRHIPFSEEFDLIGMYDVLEHIDDDSLVLRELYKSLKPSGTLVLTVPQHQWLWSSADDYAHHERRYAGKELHRKLEASGFKVKMTSSFVVTLFPMLVLSRVLKRNRSTKDYDPHAEFLIPSWVNKILYKCLSLEVFLIGVGLSFPFGGSRVVVATK